MEIRLKCLTFVILLFEIPLISSHYTEYIVEDYCEIGNETITYNLSEIDPVLQLIATSRPTYKYNKNCKIIIQPPSGFGVVASVRKIDFRQPTYYFCLDYLKIHHSNEFSPTTLCNFKFDLNEKTSYFSRRQMEMFYHVESVPDDGLGYEIGFMLTITAVTEDISDCLKDNMFMCNNQRCIPTSLTCDTKNNCGDSSDEDHLLCDNPTSPFIRVTDILFVITGCILIVIVISLCVTLVRKRRKQNPDIDSASDSDEPTAQLSPYQAVHPSGFFICQNPAGPYFQHSKVVPSEGGFSNPCYPSGFPQAPPPYSQ